jgi:two-component system chemotaxis response regulator CheY
VAAGEEPVNVELTMSTILIAEDNRVNLRLLTFTLNKAGHQVLGAEHGQAALERLAEMPVDLLIADIDMPVMDGITLLKHIRANEAYKTLPVIVLTASGENEDYLTARNAGANDVLTKPTSSNQLSETVNRMLNINI